MDTLKQMLIMDTTTDKAILMPMIGDGQETVAHRRIQIVGLEGRLRLKTQNLERRSRGIK